MPDREKVVKEYEDYVNSYISLTTSHDYEFEMHKTVLALLKEQQDEIQNLRKENHSILTQFYEWAKEQKNDKIAALEQKLKEQEDAYRKLAKEYLSLSHRAAHKPNVVKCKDCRFGYASEFAPPETRGIWCCARNHILSTVEPNFFCADGEMR